MAEKFTFSQPVVVVPPIADVALFQIHKRRFPNWYLRVVIGNEATGQEIVDIQRTGPEVQVLLTAINKANLSTKSEERRVIEWAQTQPEWTAVTGGQAGAFTGAPD